MFVVEDCSGGAWASQGVLIAFTRALTQRARTRTPARRANTKLDSGQNLLAEILQVCISTPREFVIQLT